MSLFFCPSFLAPSHVYLHRIPSLLASLCVLLCDVLPVSVDQYHLNVRLAIKCTSRSVRLLSTLHCTLRLPCIQFRQLLTLQFERFSVCVLSELFHQLYSTFYSTLLCSTLLYSTLLYSTLLYSTLLYSTLLYSTLPYSTLLYPFVCSNSFLLRTALPSTCAYCIALYNRRRKSF
jgi:hypothetical protein